MADSSDGFGTASLWQCPGLRNPALQMPKNGGCILMIHRHRDHRHDGRRDGVGVYARPNGGERDGFLDGFVSFIGFFDHRHILELRFTGSWLGLYELTVEGLQGADMAFQD